MFLLRLITCCENISIDFGLIFPQNMIKHNKVFASWYDGELEFRDDLITITNSFDFIYKHEMLFGFSDGAVNTCQNWDNSLTKPSKTFDNENQLAELIDKLVDWNDIPDTNLPQSIPISIYTNGQGAVDSVVFESKTVKELKEIILTGIEKIEDWGIYYSKGSYVKEVFHIKIKPNENSKCSDDSDSVYYTAYKIPEFPGGKNALQEIFEKKLFRQGDHTRSRKYCVSFIIEKDGKISEIRCLKIDDPKVCSKIKQALINIPDWQPALNSEREPVRFLYNFCTAVD